VGGFGRGSAGKAGGLGGFLRAGGSGWDRGSHVVSEQGAGVPHPAVPR
jgi:hypothetical protein